MSEGLPLDLSILRYNLGRILGEPLQMPQDYVVFDLETTGLELDTDVIWQIGFYLVRDGEPWDNRRRGMDVMVETSEKQLLSNRFEIERIARKRMEVFPETMPEAIVKAEQSYLHQFRGDTRPVPRLVAIKEAASFLETCINRGIPVVGHNLVRFDIPFFLKECRNAGVSFRSPDTNIIDTGMLIKSCMTRRRVLDTEYYRPAAFYRRVADERRRGAVFALDRYCVWYWRLDLKYGVETNKGHAAGYDCWVTSLVLRELIDTALNGKRSIPRDS